jgi:glycolate oxidase
VGLGKFNRILDVDYANRCVVAQSASPISRSATQSRPKAFTTHPIRRARSRARSAATSRKSGGVHCLKYGLTTNNVLGVELVTPRRRRSARRQAPRRGGYDLLGLIVGSEGCSAIVTEVTVRICDGRRRRARC